MNNNFEIGERLTGSIFKDGQLLYEDRIFITSINKDLSELRENFMQIDLFDDDQPKVAVNDLCLLTLHDGRDLNIQVMTVVEVAQQSVLIFSLEPINGHQNQTA